MNKKLIKIKIISWSIVAIIFSIIFIFFLVNRTTSSYSNTPFNTNYSKFVSVKSESFSSTINNINIDWNSGEVRILRSDSNKIKLIQKAPSNLSERKMAKAELNGDSLSIADNTIKKFFISLSFPQPTILELYLPEKLYNEVKISSVSANIYSSYLRSNTANIDSVSGDVELSGEIEQIILDNTSGNANLKNLKNKNLICSSVSGEIDIKGQLSNVESSTTSGYVSIDSSTKISNLKCDTVSGEVVLSIYNNFGFTLNFDSVSGDLMGDSLTVNQNDNIYTYKDGSSKLSVDTTSGNLKIITKNR